MKHAVLLGLALPATVSGLLALANCGGGGTGGIGSATADSGVQPAATSTTEFPKTPPADGNAQGDQYSGTYSLVLETKSCSGACGPVVIALGVPHSYCDVGDTDNASWSLKQTDGRAEIERVDLSFAMVARGGINSDGSFHVGGYATHLAGSLEGTIDIQGHFTASSGSAEKWTLTGQATSRTRGSVDGGAVDCTASFDVRSASKL